MFFHRHHIELYFEWLVRSSSLLPFMFFCKNWHDIYFRLSQTSKTNKTYNSIESKGRTIALVSFVTIYITDFLCKPEKMFINMMFYWSFIKWTVSNVVQYLSSMSHFLNTMLLLETFSTMQLFLSNILWIIFFLV